MKIDLNNFANSVVLNKGLGDISKNVNEKRGKSRQEEINDFFLNAATDYIYDNGFMKFKIITNSAMNKVAIYIATPDGVNLGSIKLKIEDYNDKIVFSRISSDKDEGIFSGEVFINKLLSHAIKATQEKFIQK